MNLLTTRMPLPDARRSFTLADVALLAGAVVVVTTYGDWRAADPVLEARCADQAVRATDAGPRPCVRAAESRAPIDPALRGLVESRRPPVPATAAERSAQAEE